VSSDRGKCAALTGVLRPWQPRSTLASRTREVLRQPL